MRPPVVFICGWAHPPRALEPALRGAGAGPEWRFLPADPRGGPSGRCPARGEPPAILVGWSLGGMLALEAAAAHPERVAGLVIVSAAARFCSGPGFPWGCEERGLRALKISLRRDARGTLDRFQESAAHPGAPLLRAEALFPDDGALEAAGGVLREGLEYLHGRDLRERCTLVRAPCLVLHGAEDRILPAAAGERLAEEIRGARFLRVEGVGHDVPLRRPEVIVDAVREMADAGG